MLSHNGCIYGPVYLPHLREDIQYLLLRGTTSLAMKICLIFSYLQCRCNLAIKVFPVPSFSGKGKPEEYYCWLMHLLQMSVLHFLLLYRMYRICLLFLILSFADPDEQELICCYSLKNVKFIRKNFTFQLFATSFIGYS